MNSCFAQSMAVRLMVIATGCVVVIAGIRAAAPILNPILLAVLFTVALGIPRSWLIKRGLSRRAIIVLTSVVALVVTMLFISLIGTTIQNLSAALPGYQQQLQIQLGALGEVLAEHGIKIDRMGILAQSENTNPLGILRYVLAGVASMVSMAVLILFYTIFLVIEMGGFSAKLDQAFKVSESARQYFATVVANLRSFLATQTQVSLITAVGVTGSLWLLGVEFAILWGFVAFLMNFVPYIGSILAAVPAIIVAFIQFGPAATVLLVLGAYLLVNVVVSYVIYPRMMSQGVDLSMFVVLAAMMFWGWVLGPVGMILAVPLTAVIRISLDSYEGSRWIAVMLGTGPGPTSRADDLQPG